MQRWGRFHQTAWNLLPTGGKGTFAKEGETGGERHRRLPLMPCAAKAGVGAAETSSHVEGSVFLPFNVHRPAGGRRARTGRRGAGLMALAAPGGDAGADGLGFCVQMLCVTGSGSL